MSVGTDQLLVVDIGNTNITLGVFRGDGLVGRWRVATDPAQTADEYAVLLEALLAEGGLSCDDLKGCALCSVVPPLTGVFVTLGRRFIGAEPLVVSARVRTGLRIRYDPPTSLGADRLVDAVAAVHRYGVPVIVVDFGTATTFNVVSAEREFLGGAIAPGVGTAARALASAAARLPGVDLTFPPSVIGRDTESAVQAGVLYGYLGLVDGMVRRLQKELGGEATVVATGGLSRLMGPRTTTVQVVDPELTLEGLRLVWEMNRSPVERPR
jgi:type III pantothenate kinase